jgi:histidyl-tRNA synthetase
MRALDKVDRLGGDEVSKLLGKGRKDDSGDFTPGANLDPSAINRILAFTGWNEPRSGVASTVGSTAVTLANFRTTVEGSEVGSQGVDELEQIAELIDVGHYAGRIVIDPSVIRGLEYYTGPVFEAELTFEVKDEKGNPVRFGSVGGGGRYDDLVGLYGGQAQGAVGLSFGVERLIGLMEERGGKAAEGTKPVLVAALGTEWVEAAQKLALELRSRNVNTRFLGAQKKDKVFRYSTQSDLPRLVLVGENEARDGLYELRIAGSQASQRYTVEDLAKQLTVTT